MRIVSICGILFFASLGWADIVTLKDGTRVEGDLRKTDTGYDLIGPAGDVTHLASENISSIQLGNSSATVGGVNSSSSAADRLASLKRSVEQVDDLNQIIDRYKNFIEQTKTAAPDVAAAAQNELAMWQARADQKLVKVGGQWVTQEQRQQALAQAAETAKQAYALMKQNNVDGAAAVIKQVLSVDPQNPVALYLQGVMLYQQDKIFPARKSFEGVNQQIHGDGATLNNLAVIAWRQGQFIGALNFYNEAMLAMPQNKEILTNVAEALAGLAPNLQKQYAIQIQKVQRTFAGQEASLEMTMARYGWYRWGTLWVDRSQLDQLKGAENDIKAKLDLMEKEFDSLQKKIDDNNQTITTDTENEQDLINRTTYYDTNGTLIHTDLPNVYYTLQSDISRLQVENKNAQLRQQSLRDEAQHTQASMPKPKFTGVQQIIGVEGTPVIGAAAAATQPASTTQPAGQAAGQPSGQPSAASPPASPPAAPAPVTASPPPAPANVPSLVPPPPAQTSPPPIPPAPAAPATNRVF